MRKYFRPRIGFGVGWAKTAKRVGLCDFSRRLFPASAASNDA
jgi:hypothetical protein